MALSAPAPVRGAEILLGRSRHNGIATVPASVTIPAGQTSATFTITTAPPPSQAFDRGALITATYNNLTRTDVLTISRGPELRAPSPNVTRVPTLTPPEPLARRSPFQRIAYTTTVTSTSDYTRHHVYTPELNLLAESHSRPTPSLPTPKPVIPGLPPLFINPCMLNPSLCDDGAGIA
ncbi:MAG TPA: hypothetical protein VF618_15745 [Thermoanaerobaculia bacterium]